MQQPKPHYTQVRQMFGAKPASQLGLIQSMNREGDTSKIDECLKVMDQMQRKIEKYERTTKEQARQQDAYNDLLIKYNTIVYKMNTNTFDNSSVHN